MQPGGCRLSRWLLLKQKPARSRAREGAKFKGGPGRPLGQTPGPPPGRSLGTGETAECPLRAPRGVAADDGWRAWNPSTPQICSSHTQAAGKPEGGCCLHRALSAAGTGPPLGLDSRPFPLGPGAPSHSPEWESPFPACQPRPSRLPGPGRGQDAPGWDGPGRLAAPGPSPRQPSAARASSGSLVLIRQPPPSEDRPGPSGLVCQIAISNGERQDPAPWPPISPAPPRGPALQSQPRKTWVQKTRGPLPHPSVSGQLRTGAQEVPGPETPGAGDRMAAPLVGPHGRAVQGGRGRSPRGGPPIPGRRGNRSAHTGTRTRELTRKPAAHRRQAGREGAGGPSPDA